MFHLVSSTSQVQPEPKFVIDASVKEVVKLSKSQKSLLINSVIFQFATQPAFGAKQFQ
jgi:hypothetical protein